MIAMVASIDLQYSQSPQCSYGRVLRCQERKLCEEVQRRPQRWKDATEKPKRLQDSSRVQDWPAGLSQHRALPLLPRLESCTKPGGHFSEDYFIPFRDMHIRQRRLVVLYDEDFLQDSRRLQLQDDD